MRKQLINPQRYDGRPHGLSHAVVDTATGTVYISGQVDWDMNHQVSSHTVVGQLKGADEPNHRLGCSGKLDWESAQRSHLHSGEFLEDIAPILDAISGRVAPSTDWHRRCLTLLPEHWWRLRQQHWSNPLITIVRHGSNLWRFKLLCAGWEFTGIEDRKIESTETVMIRQGHFTVLPRSKSQHGIVVAAPSALPPVERKRGQKYSDMGLLDSYSAEIGDEISGSPGTPLPQKMCHWDFKKFTLNFLEFGKHILWGRLTVLRRGNVQWLAPSSKWSISID